MNTGKAIKWEVLPSGCWKCTSHSTDYHGYPRLTRNGKLENLSRYIYRNNNGELLDSEMVRHKCDYPTCINPAHLVKGNHGQNMQDRDLRNRTARGERHGFARLTEKDVLDIRNNPQITLWDFARRLGVGFSTVRYARKGITWKHL